jgi:hypothetical protein
VLKPILKFNIHCCNGTNKTKCPAQPHGSIEDQMENLREVLNAGLDDVQTLAIEMVKNAEALIEEN